MKRQRGTSLIEVLVTIVILAIGLLGLAGLQTRLQAADIDSYQRAQALVLLEDMADRIASNRGNAASYVTDPAIPLGAGMICPTDDDTRQQMDAKEWCKALQGTAEITASNSKAGAMLGARGCVEDLLNGDYMITVAWQGLTPTSAPPASVTCGAGKYNDTTAGAVCVADRCRRVLTTLVRIATLT